MFLNFKKLIFVAFVSLVFFVLNIAIAGYIPSFGGEYTNLCGSGLNATFYSCSANCDINTGQCSTRSNEWMYVFVCSGKVTNCNSPMIAKFGPNSTASVTNYAFVGSDKTVQIDVFNKECDASGGWSCQGDPPPELTGYIVWWSGKQQYTPPPPSSPSPPPLYVSCYASPNPVNAGQTVMFISDVSGGVGGYTYNWSGACTGNSSVCYKSFSVAGVYTAYLTVTSGSQFQSTLCSIRVNANLPTVITLPAVESL
jgi:hypothetical protein